MHGAWHDASCWRQLQPLLAAHGHQVTTPDLPGHGDNPHDPDTLSLKVYSRYISQNIESIDNNVILVGHSMSGMVISQVGESIPDKIAGLVYLSAYLPADGQSLFDLIAANRGDDPPTCIEQAMVLSADKRRCSIAPEQIAPLFYQRCPAAMTGEIPHSFSDEAALPLAGKPRLSQARFGSLHKTYICCLDDQVIPIKHQRRMLTRQPCNEMVQLDADHSPFLSCPQTLAAVLHSISQKS